MKWLWLLAYFWSSLCSAKLHYNHFNRTDIYFAAFFPMTPVHSREGLIGRGVMPAVRLAIKHINQSPNILKGYKLHMYWNDTQVRTEELINWSFVIFCRGVQPMQFEIIDFAMLRKRKYFKKGQHVQTSEFF